MYIIYLYLLFNVQKFFPNGPAACMFRPYCYLLPLIVKIAPAQGKCAPLLKGKMFHGFCDSTAIARRFHRNRAAIVCQSPFSMFHAACRLILVMQETLRIGHCLEFTTGIEQTAFLSQPASLYEAASTDA